jgi:hypothetical protein
VAAIAAYFDDSKNVREGIFAVAGYLSFTDQWDQLFAPEWSRIIKSAPHPIKEFKASDCRQMCGEFAPPWTRHECDAITEQLVSVIVGPALPNVVGIGAAVAIDRFGELQEDARQRWERFAYLLCCGVVTDAVFQLSEDYIKDDTVQIVFDEHDELEAKVREVFKDLRSVWPAEYRRKIKSPMFEPSETLEPLQAADLLAYETYKEMKNRTETPPRKVSAALDRLVSAKRHGAVYFGRQQLIEIADNIRHNRPTAGRTYVLPTVFDSTLKEKVRSLIQP